MLLLMRATVILLLCLPPLIWSSLTVVGRAVVGDVPPISLTFWSMVAALLVLVPIGAAGVAREWSCVVREWRQLVVSAALGVAAFKSLYYLGIELTTAINASILGPTLPIMIAGSARVVLGERMSAVQLIGVVITVVGVLLTSAQGRLDLLLTMHLNAGDMLILAAFASMAVYTILLRKSPTRLSPWVFVTVIFALATVMLIPFYVMELIAGTHRAIPWRHAIAILYIGIVTYIFGIVVWNLAVARLGATLPAMSVFLIPVFGTILATGFLGEVMRWYHYAGLIFTVLGVLLTVTQGQALRASGAGNSGHG